MSKRIGMEPTRWVVGEAGDGKGVYITETNALVKFGPHVNAPQEAATMRYVLQKCPEVPVPVVYDCWTEDDGCGYISMAPMPGKDLDESWPEMDSSEKKGVMTDYKTILQRLRGLDPPPDTPIQIGAIDGRPAVDHRPSDMGPHNVLVENGRITAVLDWELSGWYPEYWEYVKMIQYLPYECWDFQSYARRLWSVGKANVFYDKEYMIDQTLDSQVVHGERVFKRPR